MGRVPREGPDNENSYLSFSLYQAKAMRETGKGGSFITVDRSIAWRVMMGGEGGQGEAWQGLRWQDGLRV